MAYITDVVIQNYRCLRKAGLELNENLNIVVGDNECGKSTFIEAVHLALTGQLNGRPVQQELHPHIINASAVAEYLAALKSGSSTHPPSAFIELYFADDPALAALKGTNNSRRENLPGISLVIEFNDQYRVEYAEYVKDPNLVKTVPIEYYVVRWRSFSFNEVTSRSIPIKPCLVDASAIRNGISATRYVVDIIKDSLDKKQQVDLALSYRLMRDRFLTEDKVVAINSALKTKRGEVSNKTLSISLDASSRANWEFGVVPHLDEIPISLVGKGEQNSVKIKLALEASSHCDLFLIEEAENHLSFSNLNTLIGHIAKKRADRQLVITTHSSFVLNKLGVASVILFQNGSGMRLKDLTSDTYEYFMKLPGHDTLRLILAKRSILVEGPSDELIVQRAYRDVHGKSPLENGVDVITVNSLAFKRFLEIADILGTRVDVVTDNDGDVTKIAEKYGDYLAKDKIKIRFDSDESFTTLEPQLLRVNGLPLVNKILGKDFSSEKDALKYMRDNKTETALRFFETSESWKAPEYILNAIY